MKKILEKLGFDEKTFFRFFLIVANSQLIYAFIAMRSVLYDPFLEVLRVNNTQFGVLMGFIGFIATFGGAAVGWLQDRFTIKRVLAVNTFMYAGLGLIMTFFNVPYSIKCIFFISFGFNADAMYWATVLKSVRTTAREDRQGTAFGFMEFFRGIWELVTNGLSVAIYTALGSTLLGMRAAMTANCAIMLLSGISILVFIPADKELAGKSGGEKTKDAFKGLVAQVKNPIVWLTGFAASCVYAIYVGVNTYFVPYLKNVYLLPVALVGVFGLVNTSVIRFLSGPVAGIVSDKKFKSSAHLMNMCYAVLAALLAVMLVLPKAEALIIPAMAGLLFIALFVYLVRGVYFAPIGEMGVPKEQSAAAMAVGSFIGYSPSFWAYPLYGLLIDTFGAEQAYRYIFMLLIVFAAIGFVLTLFMGRRIAQRRAASPA